mgnify:CR=1 FL=1
MGIFVVGIFVVLVMALRAVLPAWSPRAMACLYTSLCWLAAGILVLNLLSLLVASFIGLQSLWPNP